MKTSPSFEVSIADARTITKIAFRAASILGGEHVISRHDLAMDLTACHANGTPLKLDELLKAPRFDFVHDIIGITRHIDRSTGKLRDLFCPRCSK